MASANVELVRSIYDPWERGDFSSVDWADPEIEFELVGGTNSGRATGLAEMAQLWRDFLDAWDDLRAKAEEFRELDDERVLVLTQNTGRGKASGLDLDRMNTPGANVFHLRDGRVVRLTAYTERDQAFADLGM